MPAPGHPDTGGHLACTTEPGAPASCASGGGDVRRGVPGGRSLASRAPNPANSNEASK